MADDFMAGYRSDPPQPKQGWQPGQFQVLIIGLCCPHCGATDIRKNDNGRSDQVERWECNACRQGFKLPVTGAHRCYSTGQ